MSMPSAVRQTNETRVRHTLLTQGPMSRANLARELALTRATASNLVANLMAAGQIIELDEDEPQKQQRTGRPSTLVALNPDHALSLGAYIGADHVSLCAVDYAGQSRHFEEAELRAGQTSPAEVAGVLAALVADFVAQLPKGGALAGLNVAVPGIVTLDGEVLRAPPLGWGHVAFKQALEHHLAAVPVELLVNDANAFAYAAQRKLQSQALQNAVFVLIEDGIGGCLLSEGRLLQGHAGLAGEIGHIPMGAPGFINLSGTDSALESFFGRRAVLACFAAKGGKAESLSEFLNQIAQGDPLADTVLAECLGYFARGLAIAAALLNPEAIVIGGRASGLVRPVKDELERQLHQHLLPSTTKPALILSDVGREGPAVGAAYLQHARLHDMPQ